MDNKYLKKYNLLLNNQDLNKTFDNKKKNIKKNKNYYQLSADKDLMNELKNSRVNNHIKLTSLIKNDQKKHYPQNLNKK